MIALLWMACATAPTPPPELVTALSGFHDVPELEELSARVPDLPRHLLTLAQDERGSPLVRTRAWMLLARTEDAGPRAEAAVADPTLPVTIRTKVLRGLAEAHPAHAARAAADAWCDPSRLLRAAARRVADELEGAGWTTKPGACEQR